MIHKVQFHQIANVFGDVRKVLLIVLRDDDFIDAMAVRGQQLLFQSAEGRKTFFPPSGSQRPQLRLDFVSNDHWAITLRLVGTSGLASVYVVSFGRMSTSPDIDCPAPSISIKWLPAIRFWTVSVPDLSKWPTL